MILGVGAMKEAGRSAAAGAAWLVLAACTTNEARPPSLGDCVAGDAGCSVSTVGTGGGSGEGGTSGGCSVNASDSLCTQCANSDCCTPLAACFANTDCQNLLNCTTNCAGGSSCVSACEQQFPSSVEALSTLDS